MSIQKSNCLDENAILLSMVDSGYQSSHLQECQACMEKQQAIVKELHTLKQLSNDCLPKPRRSLRPVSIVQVNTFQYVRLKQSLVYAMMLLICVGGIFGLWPTQNPQKDQLAMDQATEYIEQVSENQFYPQKDSILPVSFHYIAADEFEVMNNPFYDYVFPVSTGHVDES